MPPPRRDVAAAAQRQPQAPISILRPFYAIIYMLERWLIERNMPASASAIDEQAMTFTRCFSMPHASARRRAVDHQQLTAPADVYIFESLAGQS